MIKITYEEAAAIVQAQEATPRLKAVVEKDGSYSYWGDDESITAWRAAPQAAATSQWQPIETPPPLGTRVLVYLSEESFSSGIGRVQTMTWNGADRTHWVITHWMPLPEPPRT